MAGTPKDFSHGNAVLKLSREERQERDALARTNLAVFALDKPDPEQWLGQMLDVLGLRERPRRAPTGICQRQGCGKKLSVVYSGMPAGYCSRYCAQTDGAVGGES